MQGREGGYFVGFVGSFSTVVETLAGNGRHGRAWREWGVHEGCQGVSVEGPNGRQSHCGGKDGLATAVTAEVSGKRVGAEKWRWQAVTRPWQLVDGLEW